MIFFKGAQINTTYPTEIVLGIFTNVNSLLPPIILCGV